MDIDKILEIIQRKVLKGTHLLIEVTGNTGRFSMQPIFQRSILVLVTKTNFYPPNQQSEK